VIDVNMKVTINGRTVEISDGYESPPPLWADNDHEAAIALLFQLLEQMCTALETDFVCPPQPPADVDGADDAAARYAAGLYEDVQRVVATAPPLRISTLGEQIRSTLDDLQIPTHHVVIPPSADDAFNRPAHIVEPQDGDL
jgi:hypothetical protein